MAKRNVWSFVDLENLGDGEVDALLAEIPSDGESDDEFRNEDEEEDVVAPVILDDYDMEESTAAALDIEDSLDGFSVASIQNLSDPGDDEDDIPLSHFVPIDKFIWKKSSTFTNTGNGAIFSESVGPTNIPDDIESPIDIFGCLLDAEIIENFVFQTNLYATQCGKTFVPVNIKEMKIFLAINILMGIKKLPSYRDFWSTQSELRDSYIPTLMSRTRFDWMLGNFHLNDNALQPNRGDPNNDKLYKLRPFLDSISHNFSFYYKMHDTLSIDESMICFKDRSSIRQYMPNKPIKWGYKVWTRADITGYIDEFQIYTGEANDTVETQLGPRVIKDLTRSLVGNHYSVYFDNYFTSLPLLRQLRAENIHVTGTIRKNRKGIPGDFKADRELKRGNFDWRMTDDTISCVKWMDKRIVLLASNCENPSETDNVVRRKKNGEMETVPCPKVLKNYNKNMGFVDKADMLKKTYEIDRKSKKWWPRIFWHFIDVSVVNAFIIYQERSENSRSMNLKAFRLAIASGLVGAGNEVPKKGRSSTERKINNYKPNVPLERRWDQALHMPVYGSYKRCALCSTRDHQRRSKWACDTCGVALCLSDKKN